MADPFESAYFGSADPADLATLTSADRSGAARSHQALAAARALGTDVVRVVNPTRARDGWESPHTVILIVTDDLPFIVDSVTALLSRDGYEVHVLLEPVIDGSLFVHAEINRESDRATARRARCGRRVRHCRRARRGGGLAADARPCARACRRAPGCAAAHRRSRGGERSGGVPRVARRRPLLVHRCLRRHGRRPPRNCAEARTVGTTRSGLRPGSPDAHEGPRAVDGAPCGTARLRWREARRRARRRRGRTALLRPLHVHGLQRDDERDPGRAAQGPGGDRAVGLSAVEPPAACARQRARDDPAETRCSDSRSIGWSRSPWGSCSSATGVDCACSSDATSSTDSSHAWCTSRATAIRPRSASRCSTCSQRVFRGSDLDFTVLVSDAVLARLHVVVQTPDADTPAVDEAELESELAAIARAWPDELRDALVAARGEEPGVGAFRDLARAFRPRIKPMSILCRPSPTSRCSRRARISRSGSRARCPTTVSHWLMLYRSGSPLLLSDVMPVLEHLDVIVVEERPYAISPAGGPPRWIYSFGIRTASGDALADPDAQARVSELFLGVWAGAIENDGLNRLVLRAGLTARQVVVVRVFVKYLHQAGMRFTEASFADALAANPGPSIRIVDLVRGPLRSRPRDGGGRTCRAGGGDRSRSEAQHRRGREPRRRPHPACAPRTRPGGGAHERVPAGRRGTVDQARSEPPLLPSACRDRRTRSGSIRHASKLCTCAEVILPVEASVGPTVATTSALRSSG